MLIKIQEFFSFIKVNSWKASFLLAAILTALLVMTTRSPLFISALYANMGLLELNSAYSKPVPLPEQLLAAQEAFTAKTNQIPNHPSAWAQVGLIYLFKGDVVLAEQAWGKSNLPTEELLQYALHAQNLDRPQIALQMYDIVAVLAPTYRDTWYYKGDILISQEEYQTAIEALKQGINGTIDGRFGISDFYLRLGEIYALHLAEADLQEAQTMYAQAIAIDDFQDSVKLIRTHFLNGEAFRILDQPTEAMAEYEIVLVHNPNHYWANVRLGLLLWQQSKVVEEAERLLLHAVATNPQEKGAYKGLGQIYFESGRLDTAQIMYEEVLNLDPTDQQAIKALVTLESRKP